MRLEAAEANRQRGAGLDDPAAALMGAFRDGDGDAFRMLYEQFFPHVARFCLRMLRDSARAEEVAQETFLNLHRYRGGYEARAPFRAYLFSIAHRLCLNELRRPRLRAGRHVSETSGDPLQGSPIVQLPAHDVPADRLAADRQRLDRVLAALAELPERQRAALVLVRFQGLSEAEAAAALGASVTALKLLLHRARAALVRRLTAVERPPVPGSRPGEGEAP